MSARFLFLDEIDAYPGDVEGEGDPIALAEARARTFGWRRKILLVSTPTIAGLSRIEREYLATDQRRYFVPCPHCGHRQHLRFERLVGVARPIGVCLPGARQLQNARLSRGSRSGRISLPHPVPGFAHYQPARRLGGGTSTTSRSDP
jgi:hypothetical protein